MRSRFFRLSVIFYLGLTCSVFAADKFPDYPVRATASYGIKAERSGVTVAAEPVEDPRDQKTYFDTNLAGKGFLPVLLVIQNASATDSFLFDLSNVGYAGVSNGGGPDVGLNKIQENISKNRIRSATLSPGSSIHGFVYIPVPKKGPREKIHLQVPIAKSGTNQIFVLNLNF
jgi:hypothetical protein